MKISLRNVEWRTQKAALRFMALWVFVCVAVALLVPRTREFLLGMAFSMSGILTLQLMRKEPFKDVDEMPNPLTTLKLQ